MRQISDGKSPRVRMLRKKPEQRLSDAATLQHELSLIGELSDCAPLSAQRVAPSLHDVAVAEQSLFCVVLAMPCDPSFASDASSGGATSEPGLWLSDTERQALREKLGQTEVSAERLANGALVVTVPPLPSATDQVTLAARAGLFLKQRWPTARVALATGRGIVAGRSAVGEVVELAVRLQESGSVPAEPSCAGVLADSLSARLLQGRFIQTPQPEGALLLSEEWQVDVSRPLLGKPTPCVGRDFELGILEAQLSISLNDSEVRAVLITAPPGSGKSRLRHEFLRRVGLRSEPPALLLGRGDLMAAGVPYGLIGQALRQLCGCSSSDPIEQQRAQLAALIAERLPTSEQARVTAFLAELCSLSTIDFDSEPLRATRSDSRQLHEEIRRAFIDFISAECARGGLLVVLDDLQWSDTLSVGLLDAALHELRGAPLCLLALARPEVRESFPKLWLGHQLQEVPLKPLSRKACERLIRQVLTAECAPELVARIAEQSAGNALFLEA